MKASLKHVVVGILGASLLAGCSNHHPGISFLVGNGDFHPILSTRPQTATETVAIVKLKEKPLLRSIVVAADGKRSIDSAAAAAVKAEQDEVLAKIQALSPKIQLLYRYRMVANGFAIVAPLETLPALRALANVAYVEVQTSFTRPVLDEVSAPAAGAALERTSTKFIGAVEAQARGIRGQGVKVGVLDTGIDHTHAMFGGAGTPEAYKAVDPSKADPGFPTAKVVGGIDLVGTEYDAGSADYARRTPKMDPNPIDEGGHGSHVAGTVAGLGDGVTSYDGVAPDAQLYAIKVFGADGSTGDAVVVAGLEYAADPNADLDLADQLDVVNLSLGSSYGNPHILYTEAMGNLSKGGTIVVASAGNSGDNDYIVGAPSVADDAISVAASVDDMDQNWKFRAVRISTPSKPDILTEAIESTMGKKISDLTSPVSAPLVFIGLADKDLSEEEKTKVAGQIALIDRGGVTFAEKIKRAQDAGAIGVVVANSKDDAPFAMGGDGEFTIPAIMISKALGAELKSEMAKGTVTVDFKVDARIEKPELIDTMAGFSSKGPRSVDALLKPEISAPGSLIISAKMGGGREVVQMSGTSMAAPHMAGVMALLKQTYKSLSSAELKSIAMNTAKTMVTEEKKVYPLSRQGAGRIQVLKALDAKVVSSPAAVSLGEVTIESKKTLRKQVTVKNITAEEQTFGVRLSTEQGAALRMAGPSSVTLAAGESKTLTFDFTIEAASLPKTSTEVDGLLLLEQSGAEVARIPVLAIAEKISRIAVDSLVVRSTGIADSAGAAVDLVLSNPSANAGDAYLFNHIATGARKEDPNHDPYVSRGCDLQEAGSRVIVKNGVPTLQIAAKLYEPMTTWDNCEISVLIDSDRDGNPEQELVGAKQDHLPGLTATTFASILLDSKLARETRRQFETDTQAKKEDVTEDYTSSIMGLAEMFAPKFTTVAIVEAPVADLKLRGSGEIAVRIAASYQEASSVEPDDFLSKDKNDWTALTVSLTGGSFVDLPEKVSLAAGETKTVSFTKGAGSEKLLVLAPTNTPVIGGLKTDQQSILVAPHYE